MDDYCGDESEEKNPYPANDYIGNVTHVLGVMKDWINDNLYHASNYRDLCVYPIELLTCWLIFLFGEIC